jgi:hypothetical protein
MQMNGACLMRGEDEGEGDEEEMGDGNEGVDEMKGDRSDGGMGIVGHYECLQAKCCGKGAVAGKVIAVGVERGRMQRAKGSAEGEEGQGLDDLSSVRL